MFAQKLKILFIAPSFPRQSSPEAFVNGKLVLAFLKLGWHVDVITQDVPDVDSSNIWKPLKDRTHRIKAAVSSKVEIVNWIVRSYLLAVRLAKKNRYNVILSRSQPIWGHVLAYFISLHTGVTWIANWSDPSPIRRYPPPYGNGPTSPVPFFAEHMFRAICKRADWHTFPSERLKNYMLSYMPSGVKERSSVIPHLFLDDQNLSCSTRSDKRSGFLLHHSGSIFYRNWRQFLDGLRKFVDKVGTPDVHVEFVGWQPKEFERAVNELNLQLYVTIEPAKSYEESLCCMIGADALLVIEAGCEEGIFLPSKIADYAQARKPIIAVSPVIGTLADLLDRHLCGVLADCTSPEAVSSSLDKIYRQWMEGSLNGCSDALEIFSEHNVISQYKTLIRKTGVM